MPSTCVNPGIPENRHKNTAEQILHVLDIYPTAEPFEQNLLLKSILEKAVYFKKKGWKPAQLEVELFLNLLSSNMHTLIQKSVHLYCLS